MSTPDILDLYARTWSTGSVDAALVEAGLHTARQGGDHRRVMAGCLALSIVRERQGAFQESRTWCDEGLSVARFETDPVIWARLFNHAAYLDLVQGDIARALRPLTAVVRRCRDHAEVAPEEAQAAGNLGGALFMLGDLDAAIPWYERAVARAMDLESGWMAVQSLADLSVLLVQCGRVEDGRRRARAARDLLDRQAVELGRLPRRWAAIIARAQLWIDLADGR